MNPSKLLKISTVREILGSPWLNSFVTQQFLFLFSTSSLPSLVSWDSLFSYFCCPSLELSFIVPVSRMCTYVYKLPIYIKNRVCLLFLWLMPGELYLGAPMSSHNAAAVAVSQRSSLQLDCHMTGVP